MIEIAQWDTDHFGMKVGNLTFDDDGSKLIFHQEIEAARKEGYSLLYYKGRDLSKEILNENVFLADEKVLYSQLISRKRTEISKDVISIKGTSLDASIFSIALQSGGHSRYYRDKHFPIDVYLTLYEEWIKNSLNGSIATDVLAYRDGDKYLGLLTYKLTGNCAEIGLLAVDHKSTHKGIGSQLIQSFLSILPVGTTVKVATQKCNKRACMFYEKNGFSLDSITNIYHIWLQ